ncbi:protein ALTERED PHOSPHATE STARVATION RESPONSE 1-like [Arachis stenosperma]|uniref:protein ALTERED PHOSPHATE STARVATION RESPONSE 1-like n=1 Tax=Arachis stenosperma TaxID=217475 RepID=UPI0025ABBFE7|nr:protein ALTERED PHOSPHATE STARVATION RESPONSE 1-like [Arachis stenosperma]XP_057727084.1 protein ALTERED PHOSPHATE STARVATION RESPONSE 1-like [Arachis stenosperma]
MGCSQSRLDDQESVQICKDRKRLIKQAVEQRAQFASGHIAYIQSLKRVSAAMRNYIQGDEPHQFSLDSFITPVKKTSPAFISISSKSFTPTTIEFSSNSTLKVNYLRPSGNPPILVEERPPSPEMVRVETYSPMEQYAMDDGFFVMQSSPMNSSAFAYSPNNRPSIPPPSPQTSQWDSFWNPFTSLDYYGYPTRSSLEETIADDEDRGLRRVREAEGIPDLEEVETEKEDFVGKRNVVEERIRTDINSTKEEVTVEDEEEEDRTKTEIAHEVKESKGSGSERFQVSKVQTAGQVESTSHQEVAGGNQEAKVEAPGFTVYVNRRPTSMAEVIRDLDVQFTKVCNAANEFSALLEVNKAQNSSMSNELSASKLLNPVALFRSSSSRFLKNNSSSTGDDGCKGTSDPVEEQCMFSGSHQSTLDRLYAWEKKLYEEVRSGERVRIAYEKKCLQLKNHDVKGEDPSYEDKTRAAIRDLHTQITISIHSIEAISKRIETLRDEELHPQLLELLQGLAKMWNVMAECHQMQKITLDEAKILLTGTDVRKQSGMSITDPHRLACSASILETELRNWRSTFESWITSQRSYIRALAGWLLRCMRCEPDASKLLCSPRRSSSTHPLFGLCVQWSRRLDAIQESVVLDGIDFFAAGIGSFYAQQLKEDSRQNVGRSTETNESMEMVEAGPVKEAMSTEQLAEIAIRVLCAGMSAAMSSMAEFAVDSAEGYNELVKQWENEKLQQQQTCVTGT